MPSRCLLLFLREPQLGQVKTRLATTMGDTKALAIYRAMVRILLQQLSGLSDCQLRICLTPDDAEEALRFWLLSEIIDDGRVVLDHEQVDFHAQGGGDLGDRLGRAFQRAFDAGYEKVGAIGSDCIDLSGRWVNTAFALLNDRHQLVIGPCPDGGYHFLATQQHHAALFQGIPWSSSQTFSATMKAAEAEALAAYTLPLLGDIDTEADYETALQGALGRRLKKLVDAELAVL